MTATAQHMDTWEWIAVTKYSKRVDHAFSTSPSSTSGMKRKNLPYHPTLSIQVHHWRLTSQAGELAHFWCK
jgi:hypothetical protein